MPCQYLADRNPAALIRHVRTNKCRPRIQVLPRKPAALCSRRLKYGFPERPGPRRMLLHLTGDRILMPKRKFLLKHSPPASYIQGEEV